MFKHKINYVDFNGNDREEVFEFHLSIPEVVRFEAKIGEDIGTYAKKLVESKDLNGLVSFLEDIILTSYGKKTQDGRSFIKTKDIREEFEYSPAYAELFEELLQNPDLATKFGEQVADNGKQKRNVVAPKVVQ